ncbi:endolytic transglycosylase MltG [Thalassotalea ganghwensis]
MFKTFKIVKYFVHICVAVYIGYMGVKAFANYKLSSSLTITTPEFLVITQGETVNQLARELFEKGLIDSTFWLKVFTKLNPEYTKIKAGTYQLSDQLSVLSLLELLVAGYEHQFTITFIEGSTFKDWLLVLEKHPFIKQTISASQLSSTLKQLGIAQSNPEGLFFPDTYAFTANTTDSEILARANQRMNAVLATLWQNRSTGLPYQNQYEALIMASIIEKESGKHAEHQLIASVFVNRLEKNMRLQTDPTVIYGLGDRYQGDITRAHLKEKTAYNTYRINGLPPTPIAMPGKSAIYAALNPLASDYYYFVSDGKGNHIFSKDLSSHNRAVAQYQKN